MRKIFFAAFFFVLSCQAVFAQTGGIKASDVSIKSSGEGVTLSMTITVAPGAVNKLQGMAVIPLLTDAAGNSAAFPHVLVNGKNRARIYARHTKFRYTEIVQNPPYEVMNLSGSHRDGGTIDYSARVATEPWMGEAALSLVFELASPAGERQSYTLPMPGMLIAASSQQPAPTPTPTPAPTPTPKPPVLQPAPVVPAPQVPAAATFNLSGTANLDFETASSSLLPTFGHNAAELARVDRIIGQIAATPGARIVSVTITGYSSPDGRYETNVSLAHDRAMSLSRYMEERHGISAATFRIRAVGEDWSGLRSAVVGSYLSFPPEVLTIIDSADAPDAKESRLRRMSGGQIWQRMERELFARLRKVDYSIDYQIVQ